MSWLEWFGARPKMPGFARALQRALAKRSQGDWVLNDGGNALTRGDATINLHNLFLEYANASRKGRASLIDKYCSIAAGFEQKIPGIWVVAERNIFPTVRSRFDRALIDTQRRLELLQPVEGVTWPFCGDLHTRLVYDHGQHLAHLELEQVAVWGQPPTALLEAACRNLGSLLPAPSWQPLQHGLMQLESDVSYTESFLLLDRVIKALPFHATAIFMPCNRGILLAADSGNEGAVLAMVQLAESCFEERPWAMSATVLRCSDRGWQEVQLSGEAGKIAAGLQRRTMAEHYAAQRQLLNQEDAGEGALFHAEYNMVRSHSDHAIRSWCSWAQGVASSLPQTDLVVLTRDSGQAKPQVLEVTWATLSEICSDKLVSSPDMPPRYVARSFPDEAQWQQLVDRGSMLGAN